MLTLTLNELKVIVKSRGIKDHKGMSEDELLSALNESESVKSNEKNFMDTKLIKNEDYDADEILRKKKTIPDPTKIDKTIRDIRKENYT